MVGAGMNVARLNFSHGSYEDHAQTIALIRQVAAELNTPVTLLQDLQGPKVRVGHLPAGVITLKEGEILTLVPLEEFKAEPETIPIDYPLLASEAEPGTQVLLDDGLLELQVKATSNHTVQCQVIRGGLLKSRKGINLPSLNLHLPSLTDKDLQDLDFGIAQSVDWISLSFIRQPADVRSLKDRLAERGADIPVIGKLEKPQAIENLEAILAECDGVMVARGDLGVEISPEKVPMLQKRIIRLCNERSIPVITATQMLESMILNPRPTRAEASDVANAIADGTDAIMLSGETAVGSYPVQSVEMMARIAREVEKQVTYIDLPPAKSDETHAISEALNAIYAVLDLHCIVALSSSGYTARLASAQRLGVPVIALTTVPQVYHRLNLFWGVQPLLLKQQPESFEQVLAQIEQLLLDQKLAKVGDRLLIIGGIPMGHTGGTNFLKIHTVVDSSPKSIRS